MSNAPRLPPTEEPRQPPGPEEPTPGGEGRARTMTIGVVRRYAADPLLRLRQHASAPRTELRRGIAGCPARADGVHGTRDDRRARAARVLLHPGGLVLADRPVRHGEHR